MVPHGPAWSCMVPYGPVGTVWCSMVSYGHVCSRIVPYGTVWSHMVLYDPMSHMVLYGPIWFCMVLLVPHDLVCSLLGTYLLCRGQSVATLWPIWDILTQKGRLQFFIFFYLTSLMSSTDKKSDRTRCWLGGTSPLCMPNHSLFRWVSTSINQKFLHYLSPYLPQGHLAQHV